MGNDGEPDSLVDIYDEARPAIMLDTNHKGLGANLNFLINAADDFMLQMDDDHQLIKELDINNCIRKLLEDNRAGMVRLMHIGGHRYSATLQETFWKIDWNSPELYITSNRPHLKRKKFHNLYGYYHEGLTLGQTEEWFCHTCIDMSRMHPDETLDVLIPLDLPTESAWDHVGASWQLKGY